MYYICLYGMYGIRLNSALSEVYPHSLTYTIYTQISKHLYTFYLYMYNLSINCVRSRVLGINADSAEVVNDLGSEVNISTFHGGP